MNVVVLSQCRKEIEEFPLNIKIELLEAMRDLEAGVLLSMPISRKMKGLGPAVFELRFKESAGIFRVIYFMKKGDAIFLIHAFQKKTNKTSKKNIDVSLQRIKRLL